MSVSSALIATNLENDIHSSRGGYKILSRTRKTVQFIFDDLGPRIVKRAYRMSDKSFWKLLVLIKENYNPGIKLNNIQNGEIKLCARLSMPIRWFAGGDQYDISQNHGVSTNEVMKSVWIIVDLVNMCEQIKIKFPSTHADQEKVADGFKKKSWAEFDNCVGCM